MRAVAVDSRYDQHYAHVQILTVAALAVVPVGPRSAACSARARWPPQDRVPEHYQTFTAALTAIQTEYAEPVESDRLVYGAINGMLQTLDPHSSFMDPRTYAQMRERQEGRYYGLGLTISVGRRRHHRGARVRRLAGVSARACAAAT